MTHDSTGLTANLHSVAIEVNILTTVMNKMARADVERRLGETGLTSALQYAILRMLSHRAYTVTELSRMIRLEPATLIPSVDALERKGLAKRGHDPNDRRRAPLELTSEGESVLARVPAASDGDAMVEGLRRLGPAKQQSLVELLRELMSVMADDPDMVNDVTLGVSLQVARDDGQASADQAARRTAKAKTSNMRAP